MEPAELVLIYECPEREDEYPLKRFISVKLNSEEYDDYQWVLIGDIPNSVTLVDYLPDIFLSLRKRQRQLFPLKKM